MKKAVILDRDGVINDHRHFVNTPDDLYLFPVAGPSIHRLNDAGYFVFVATNQGGVGLGYSTEEALHAVHEKMIRELAADGAYIDEIAACTHKPHAGCACRKPKPGMILTLQEKYGFSAKDSFMVGDMETDVEAGQAAGMRTIRIGEAPSAAEYIAKDLADAVDFVLSKA